MLKTGKTNGLKTFYLVAEMVHMESYCVDIKLSNNENWAKQNKIIGKIKADTEQEAREYFRVRDMTR